MKRRNFIRETAMASTLAGFGILANANDQTQNNKASNSAKFKLKYAPSFGSFPESAGKDPIDLIRFCSDQGFRAMFDNNLNKRPIEEQDKIVAEMARRNMDIGPVTIFSEGKENMVLNDPEIKNMILTKTKEGVEFCKRTGVKWGLITCGYYNQKLAWDYQTANVIDLMREMSEIAQEGGMIIVMEPLNPFNHPGFFLKGIPQAYALCRAVNSPSCKIIDDLYHQQISEGNLIPNVDAAWSEIAAFHIGDNPGRREPGTGEINYLNIFKHIHEKGFDGVLGMEHGRSIKGKEGELAVIEAYRKVDNF